MKDSFRVGPAAEVNESVGPISWATGRGSQSRKGLVPGRSRTGNYQKRLALPTAKSPRYERPLASGSATIQEGLGSWHDHDGRRASHDLRQRADGEDPPAQTPIGGYVFRTPLRCHRSRKFRKPPIRHPPRAVGIVGSPLPLPPIPLSQADPDQPTDAAWRARATLNFACSRSGGSPCWRLACAVPFSLNLVDPDLWGHVRYGQDWLAEGDLPRTASHTYTAVGHPWINHENVAELLLAIGFAHLPVHVMLVLKCLVGMAILAAWSGSRVGVASRCLPPGC